MTDIIELPSWTEQSGGWKLADKGPRPADYDGRAQFKTGVMGDPADAAWHVGLVHAYQAKPA